MVAKYTTGPDRVYVDFCKGGQNEVKVCRFTCSVQSISTYVASY